MRDKEAQKKDFEYFVANMLEFNKLYGQKFVAIKNQGILGVYDTFLEAVDTTMETEKLGTFLVQACFDDIEKLTIRCYNQFKPVPAW